MKLYRFMMKPLLDFLISLFLLILCSPIIILIIFLLFFFQNTDIFFVQKRPGLNGRVFKIIKFKTMRDDFDANGNLLPDAFRITKLGKFIRSTSLDELLQLINVLMGDMSLIGPRPLLIKYLDRYSPEQAKRHLVKPGITGWAQVNGRNSLSWQEKFQLDVFYVENINFLLDIKIIFMTFKSVLNKNGVNQSENITMNEFMGNS